MKYQQIINGRGSEDPRINSIIERRNKIQEIISNTMNNPHITPLQIDEAIYNMGRPLFTVIPLTVDPKSGFQPFDLSVFEPKMGTANWWKKNMRGIKHQ